MKINNVRRVADAATGVVREEKPFALFWAEVTCVDDLTPSMRRVTFTGPELGAFGDPGFDQRIKLIFPKAGAALDALINGDEWYPAWCALPDEHRPPIRTYTTRAVRPDCAEIDVDMVRHEPAGPAGRWLAEVVPGERILIVGPNARYAGEVGGVDFVAPEVTDAFLIGGDETAAPAISRILEDLPAEARGIAVVEFPDDADAAYLPTHPGIEVRAFGRGKGKPGDKLVAEVARAAEELAPIGTPVDVEEIDVDKDLLWEVPRHAKGGAALKRTGLYAWLAGEACAVKSMRRHLVSVRGIDRRSVAFMGYWRIGKAEN